MYINNRVIKWHLINGTNHYFGSAIWLSQTSGGFTIAAMCIYALWKHCLSPFCGTLSSWLDVTCSPVQWGPSNWASYFMATMMCHLCLYVVSTKTSAIKQFFYKNVQSHLMTPGLSTCGHLPRLLEGLFQEICTIEYLLPLFIYCSYLY